ncbi:MAG: arginine repressor [Oscillospiraceae bacterium]
MTIKSSRLNEISRLIKEQCIGTQDELLLRLRERNFAVTQATVSRDIKELRLVKQTDDSGRSFYAAPGETAASAFTEKFRTIFHESVIKVATAGNIVVLKCYTGMGNAACAALDTMSFSHVVGTIAGDDTIFAAAETPESAKELARELGALI